MPTFFVYAENVNEGILVLVQYPFAEIAHHSFDEGKESRSLAWDMLAPYAHMKGLYDAAGIVAIEDIL